MYCIDFQQLRHIGMPITVVALSGYVTLWFEPYQWLRVAPGINFRVLARPLPDQVLSLTSLPVSITCPAIYSSCVSHPT